MSRVQHYNVQRMPFRNTQIRSYMQRLQFPIPRPTISTESSSVNEGIKIPIAQQVEVKKIRDPEVHSIEMLGEEYRGRDFAARGQISKNSQIMVNNPQAEQKKQQSQKLQQVYRLKQIGRIPELHRLITHRNVQLRESIRMQTSRIPSLSQQIKVLPTQRRIHLQMDFVEKGNEEGKTGMERIIGKGEIMFPKELLTNIESQSQVQGLWIGKGCSIRVIKNQFYEFCPRVEDKNLVKIHGRVKLKFFNFLVTPSFNQNTLEKQINQFGQYTQQLVFKHIKSLFQGLSALHGSGIHYNFLTLDKIMLDFKGNALIDIARYQPSATINNEDKKKYFFYLSSEIIIENQSMEQNDVWALGCIALSMILGRPIDFEMDVHPYNISQQKLQQTRIQRPQRYERIAKIIRFRNNIGNNKFMLPKIKRSQGPNDNVQSPKIGTYISKLSSHESKYGSSKMKQSVQLHISDQLMNFIQDCLQLEVEIRPNFRGLAAKYHFLKGL